MVIQMTDPIIICPTCKTEIKLTESLAAPLLESTRRQYEQRLADKDAEVAKREAAIRSQQTEIAKAQESIDELVADRLKAERAGIAASEAKKARDALADELAKAQEEKSAADELLKDRDAKLAEARKNELELRQDRQRLQDEKERFELDKQRAIDAERAKIRESSLKEADEKAHLKLAEKDKTISDLQVKLQDALRKAEQGSQQLQGEVQELELEAILRESFPWTLLSRSLKESMAETCFKRLSVRSTNNAARFYGSPSAHQNGTMDGLPSYVKISALRRPRSP